MGSLLERLAAEHDLSPLSVVESRTKSSHVVLIADESYVFKFAVPEPLWPSVETEALALEVAAKVPGVGARLIGVGHVPELEGMPYLISGFIQGTPIGDSWGRMPKAQRLALSRELGVLVAGLHCVTPSRDVRSQFPGLKTVLSAARSIRRAKLWAERPTRRQRYSASALARLVAGIEALAPEAEEFFQSLRCETLCHNDLWEEHIRLGPGGQVAGIIDFGDADLAPPEYELLKLHTRVFRGCGECLAEFLSAYAQAGGPKLDLGVCRNIAVLHRFPEYSVYAAALQALGSSATLDEVLDRIWCSFDLPHLQRPIAGHNDIRSGA